MQEKDKNADTQVNPSLSLYILRGGAVYRYAVYAQNKLNAYWRNNVMDEGFIRAHFK